MRKTVMVVVILMVIVAALFGFGLAQAGNCGVGGGGGNGQTCPGNSPAGADCRGGTEIHLGPLGEVCLGGSG
jgi:hypothetical protein